MIKSVLTNSKNKKALHTHDGYDGDPVLVTTQHKMYAGGFKSISQTVATTTVLVQPNGNDAIVLTDLIITTEKQAGGSVTVQFTDGTNTIIILSANVVDAPCNLAIPFAGNWEGWQSARISVVNVGDVIATVSCGYFKISESTALPYDEWLARR